MSDVRQFFLREPNCNPYTGAIISMPNDSYERDGYIYCDGVAIDRTDYDVLFNSIGTLYGVGDGSTTFNLPDLRGLFVRGWDNGAEAVGTYQVDDLLSHRHDYYIYYNGGQGVRGYTATNSDGNMVYDSYNDAILGNETRPDNIYVKYYIRYI